MTDHMSDHQIENRIEDLVQDLTPTCPLQNRRLFSIIAGGLAIACLLVLEILGLRWNYAAAIHSGTIFWKSSVFLLAGTGGAFYVLALSRPASWRKTFIKPAALFILAAIMVFLSGGFLAKEPIAFDMVAKTASFCWACVGVLSIVLTLLFWRGWLRRSASTNPTALGAATGFTAGCYGASAYALYCDKDTLLYVGLVYGSAVLLMTVVGAVLGGRLLRW